MSSFDPQSFLDATTTEAATRRPPLPAGLDVLGTIEDVSPRPWQNKEDPSKHGLAFDIKIRVQVPLELVPSQGAETVLITDAVFVDLTEGGAMDWAPGRNRRLGRYRTALDLNTPGQAFNPRMMIGRLIRAKIKHDPYQGEIYDRVDAVAKAA